MRDQIVGLHDEGKGVSVIGAIRQTSRLCTGSIGVPSELSKSMEGETHTHDSS